MAIIKKSDIYGLSATHNLSLACTELNELFAKSKKLDNDCRKLIASKSIKICEYCNTKIQSNKTNCVNCGAPN